MQEDAAKERQETRLINAGGFEPVFGETGLGKRRRIEAKPEVLELVDEDKEVVGVRRALGRKGRRKEGA